MNGSPLLLPTKMVPRRFYTSPVYIILAILLVNLVAANVIFFYTSHHSSPFAAAPLTSAESYLLKPGATLQGYIDSVDDPEFWESFANELKTTKSKELIDNLRATIKNTYYTQFLRELRTQVFEDKLAEFTNQLKLQIEYEKTKGISDSMTKSFSIFDQLKQEYLESHVEEIKSELLLELKNSDNNDKGQKALSSKLDKTSYYQYVLNDIFTANSPVFPGIDKKELGKGIPPIHSKFTRTPAFSLEELYTDHVNLNVMKIQDLRESHEKLVNILYHLEAPPFVWGDGIVLYSGGDGTKDSSNTFDDNIAQALLVVRQLRETGSKLPIEVIFPMNDLDGSICSMMYDKFNAKCISIEAQLNTGPKSPFKILLDRGVYWKPFGLLVSSFDNIISIDSNNIPLQNVDKLLSAKSFLETKWVMWPHHWQKTTSPVFYRIAGMRMDGELIRRDCYTNDKSFVAYIKEDKKNQCIHDREGLPSATTVESSQMVFSKRTHYRSFLLSLYYNLLGPSHYYHLFYQNSPTFENLNLGFNKPDRETYVPALHVFKEQYHLMKYLPESIGPIKSPNELEVDNALLQADPVMVDDFYEKWRVFLADKGYDYRILAFEDSGFTQELRKDFVKALGLTERKTTTDDLTGDKSVLLVSKNYKLPKAFFMQLKNGFMRTVLRGNGQDRVLGPLNEFSALVQNQQGSDDWELKLLKLVQWVSCEELKDEKYWKSIGEADGYPGDTCKIIGHYINVIEQTAILK